MSTALERVNLNLPTPARHRLRALAKAIKKPEGVYARELLLEAIERAERRAFKERLEKAYTPEARARDREILEAIERARGQPR
jgi:hypothetical protein